MENRRGSVKLGTILLGAAIGVGAVAAAPFTGGGSILAGVSAAASLAGTATVATAVGAGGVGAIVGAVASDIADDERAEERRYAKERGFEDGLKKGEEQVKKEFNQIMDNVKKRDDFIIGLTAFCYAVANCDNEIAAEELDELDYYLNYIKTDGTLSPAVKGELTKIKNRKDGFDNITKKLDKIDVEDLARFSKILEDIIDADDIKAPEELEIKEKWNLYYEQRKA